MKLPGVEQAVVSKEKIIGYLLSLEHWSGRGKAIFFLRFGFQTKKWRELADALIEHAAANEIESEVKTDYGKKYIIEGEIETPSGRRPVVRTVWFIAKGESIPRFVTAYPEERRKHI